ncbi:LysR family transcriptional regulator [Cryobacterium sp. TMT2-42-4]|nr:LysR family transcriptional regulator [Cryobacterium sp. TMT2-42-4]
MTSARSAGMSRVAREVRVSGARQARPPTADRRPPTADRRPPTADRRPPTADRRPAPTSGRSAPGRRTRTPRSGSPACR